MIGPDRVLKIALCAMALTKRLQGQPGLIILDRRECRPLEHQGADPGRLQVLDQPRGLIEQILVRAPPVAIDPFEPRQVGFVDPVSDEVLVHQRQQSKRAPVEVGFDQVVAGGPRPPGCQRRLATQGRGAQQQLLVRRGPQRPGLGRTLRTREDAAVAHKAPPASRRRSSAALIRKA